MELRDGSTAADQEDVLPFDVDPFLASVEKSSLKAKLESGFLRLPGLPRDVQCLPVVSGKSTRCKPLGLKVRFTAFGGFLGAFWCSVLVKFIARPPPYKDALLRYCLSRAAKSP